MKRVNFGCGPTPISGWYNYDNSFSVCLAKHRILTSIMDKLGLLKESQKKLIAVARKSNIIWADATKRILLPDNSVEVLYSSHMIEHLDREEVKVFMQQTRRVLAAHGIIRIVVPDFRKLATQYISDGDADAFLERSGLTRGSHRTLLDKLKYLIIGERHHLWMYDGPSMVRLLSSMGFKDTRIMPAGSTMIPDPGELCLYERSDESVYVEAYNDI